MIPSSNKTQVLTDLQASIDDLQTSTNALDAAQRDYAEYVKQLVQQSAHARSSK